ncbi:MAG: alpha/beta hydrolase [Prolixibacteraceae bacterium]|nr:alpha/beta hydrolase [Prolixibacteraceae bacterium]
MKELIVLFTCILWALGAKTAEVLAQTNSSDVSIISEGIELHGTEEEPETKENFPVVLLIAGSGPTDRNGNQPGLTNNSFKLLAKELALNGIGSVRYDKRGIAQSHYEGFSNAAVRFDHYVTDAVNWINYLKENEKYSRVYVAGLSEGSLIGMLAAKQAGADGFISLNGPGRPADKIILQQVSRPGTPENVVDEVKTIIGKIKKGENAEEIPPYLMSLFNPDIQPYLRSWFRYNPSTEIGKITFPVLIIQGENDIQVSVEDAGLLKKGNPSAKKVIIPGMNHILKNAEDDFQLNYATYNNPDLPVNGTLVQELILFMQ